MLQAILCISELCARGVHPSSSHVFEILQLYVKGQFTEYEILKNFIPALGHSTNVLGGLAIRNANLAIRKEKLILKPVLSEWITLASLDECIYALRRIETRPILEKFGPRSVDEW